MGTQVHDAPSRLEGDPRVDEADARRRIARRIGVPPLPRARRRRHGRCWGGGGGRRGHGRGRGGRGAVAGGEAQRRRPR